jgi:hypothetical protein
METPIYVIESRSDDSFSIYKNGSALSVAPRKRLNEALRLHGFVGTDLECVNRQLDAVGRAEIAVPPPLCAGSSFT